jgi:BolA protein
VTRIQRIEQALRHGFPDARIGIEDESHLHVGHAGAATGHGHFRLSIASSAFTGLSPIARHRAVYAALGDLMQTDIHAVSIDARTP